MGDTLLLSECVSVPERLMPFFSDYRVRVFDIPRMSDEQIKSLKSDFAVVADYFTQISRTGTYAESPQKMRHPDSVLKLMSAASGNRKFEEAQNTFLDEEVENFSMAESAPPCGLIRH